MKVNELTTYTQAQIQANRLLWLAALRSGEYTSCTGRLVEKGDDGTTSYCPLGVAVAVVTPDLPLKTRIDRNLFFWSFLASDGNYYTSSLPPETRCALGLHARVPNVQVDGVWSNIACLNDVDGYSLEQIADIIGSQSPLWDGTL